MTTKQQSTVPTTPRHSGTEAVPCPYCDRPFATEQLRDLHVGEAHPDMMTEEDAARYTEAVDRESDELFVLHLKVVAALVLTFFAIAYLYVFVLS